MKNKNGISLIVLVVTIIVLLILVGISVIIAKDLLIDKAVEAYAKTEESILKEKIEMAWIEAKAVCIGNKGDFQEELTKILEKNHLQNVNIENNEDINTNITFSYQDQLFNYIVSADGKVSLYNPLKGNVKIGDYIEYPIGYVDTCSTWYKRSNYTHTDGWRVIDDGIMEGTSGHVKIISTGIPANWTYDGNSESAINDLINHFEDKIILQVDNLNIDGNEYKDETISVDKFKIEGIANKVTTVSLNDINKIDDQYGLFALNQPSMYMYWLANKKEDNDIGIFYMSDEGIDYCEEYMRMGIRPIIELKDELKCKLENNVWKIIH